MNFSHILTLSLITIASSPVLNANADCLGKYQEQLTKTERKLKNLPDQFKKRAHAEESAGVFTNGRNTWYDQSAGLSINLGSTEESLSKDRSEYQQIIEMIQNPESQSAEEGFRKLTQMFVDAGRSDVDSKILIQKFNDFNKDEVICDYRPLSLKKISKLMIRSL